MSTMIPNTARMWGEIERRFIVWLRRGNSRSEMRNLSDRELRDIGMSRYDAGQETAKPFWMG